MKEYANAHLFIPLEPDFGQIMSSLMLYVYIYMRTHTFSMMILVLKMQHCLCTNLLFCILHIIGIFNIYVVSFVLCKDSSEPY